MSTRKLWLGLAAGLLAGLGQAQAQISDGVVRVGVLNDISGVFQDTSGPGSVAAARMAAALFDAGVNVQPILFHVVPERSARLRFFLSSEHTAEEIERSVAALVAAREACLPRLRAG